MVSETVRTRVRYGSGQVLSPSLNFVQYDAQIERERESTYNDSFEVDESLVSGLVVRENSMSKLRYIMASITFTRNVKFSSFVFRKSF